MGSHAMPDAGKLEAVQKKAHLACGAGADFDPVPRKGRKKAHQAIDAGLASLDRSRRREGVHQA
jgi:hypothetical protein